MTRRPPLSLVNWELDNDGFASPHVQAGMEFFPIPGDHPFRKQSSRSPVKVRLSDRDSEDDASLLALGWSKSLGAPSGAWQVTLRARESLNGLLADELVAPGDWCAITIYRNGTPLPLCVGRVDTVKDERRVVGGGATARVWTLTGRDHGALAEYPMTYTTMFAQTVEEIVKGVMAKSLNFSVGGRPNELFETLIKGAFSAGRTTGQWVLPAALTRAIAQAAPAQRGLDDLDVQAPPDETEKLDAEGRRFGDLLKTVTILTAADLRGLRGRYYNPKALWTTGGQNLHETLAQWTNPMLNEYWYDLLPPAGQLSGQPHGMQELEGGGPRGRPGAIIRERPFVSTELGRFSPWFSLPTWTIPTWVLDSSTMARSDAERKNLFNITVGLGVNHEELAAIERPLWNREDIRRNGLREFDQNTRFVEGPSQAEYLEDRRTWLRLLVDWWAPSPYLRSGTVSSRAMMPEIRVGNRVLLTSGNPQEAEQAYVEATSITYAAPPSANAGRRSTTSLALTRGFRGTDQELLTAVRGLSAQFTEVDKKVGI